MEAKAGFIGEVTIVNGEEETTHVAPLRPLLNYQRDLRIEEILNSVARVKGRANVLVKDLFCSQCGAAVVIRRKDGTYLDPCDFRQYLRTMKKARKDQDRNEGISA